MLLFAVAFAGPLSEGAELMDYGDPAGAAEVWGPIAEDGWSTGALKYNLGNAHYERGDLPRALAFWRAAALQRPRTGGLHHNIAMARSQMSAVPTPAPSPALWMQILTPGELGLLGVLLALCGSVLLLVRRRRKEASRLPAVGIWVLGLAAVVLASWGWWEQARSPIGVVVDQPARVRDAPELTASVRFELVPGAEVTVVDAQHGFVLVQTGEGRRGWVTDGALLRVPL